MRQYINKMDRFPAAIANRHAAFVCTAWTIPDCQVNRNKSTLCAWTSRVPSASMVAEAVNVVSNTVHALLRVDEAHDVLREKYGREGGRYESM